MRRVPETGGRRPSGSRRAPSERGKNSYQEPNRARVRSTWRGCGPEAVTSSRSGCRSSTPASASAGGSSPRRRPTTASRTTARSCSPGIPSAARSRSRAPSSKSSASSSRAVVVSGSACVHTSAACRQVASGSAHASTVKLQRPGAGAATSALQRSVPGCSSRIGTTGPGLPCASLSTTRAPTAPCPSRNTVALTMNPSPTTAFAGRRPSSTRGLTSTTGIRPTAGPGPSVPSSTSSEGIPSVWAVMVRVSFGGRGRGAVGRAWLGGAGRSWVGRAMRGLRADGTGGGSRHGLGGEGWPVVGSWAVGKRAGCRKEGGGTAVGVASRRPGPVFRIRSAERDCASRPSRAGPARQRRAATRWGTPARASVGHELGRPRGCAAIRCRVGRPAAEPWPTAAMPSQAPADPVVRRPGQSRIRVRSPPTAGLPYGNQTPRTATGTAVHARGLHPASRPVGRRPLVQATAVNCGRPPARSADSGPSPTARTCRTAAGPISSRRHDLSDPGAS
ncbi:hypothetical protein RKD23_004361 [Streptomyces sp. SAI-170]